MAEEFSWRCAIIEEHDEEHSVLLQAAVGERSAQRRLEEIEANRYKLYPSLHTPILPQSCDRVSAANSVTGMLALTLREAFNLKLIPRFWQEQFTAVLQSGTTICESGRTNVTDQSMIGYGLG